MGVAVYIRSSPRWNCQIWRSNVMVVYSRSMNTPLLIKTLWQLYRYRGRCMGGATSFKPCMLISSPSLPLPSPPLPYPPTPIIPSIPFSSLPVPGGGVAIPPTPFPPFPSPPFSPSRGSHPLNQLGGLGERPQWGLRRILSRQTIWCISGPKGAALVATVFVHFIRINAIFCDFEAEGSIKFS